jgi:hypothetical protein
MTAQGASPGVGVARLKSPEGATQMDRPLVGLEPTQVESLAFKARVVQRNRRSESGGKSMSRTSDCTHGKD